VAVWSISAFAVVLSALVVVVGSVVAHGAPFVKKVVSERFSTKKLKNQSDVAKYAHI